MDIEPHDTTRPPFVLEEYFAGRTAGWGVMQGRFGGLLKELTVEAVGSFDPATRILSLVETYRFADGRIDPLRWTIRRASDSRYVGQEPRLVTAAEGEQHGNSFRWRYRRRVPDGERILAFDDRFWLQPGGVLISRASVRKYGVEIATLTVAYRKGG
jgi:hypothetical protein